MIAAVLAVMLMAALAYRGHRPPTMPREVTRELWHQ